MCSVCVLCTQSTVCCEYSFWCWCECDPLIYIRHVLRPILMLLFVIHTCWCRRCARRRCCCGRCHANWTADWIKCVMGWWLATPVLLECVMEEQRPPQLLSFQSESFCDYFLCCFCRCVDWWVVCHVPRCRVNSLYLWSCVRVGISTWNPTVADFGRVTTMMTLWRHKRQIRFSKFTGTRTPAVRCMWRRNEFEHHFLSISSSGVTCTHTHIPSTADDNNNVNNKSEDKKKHHVRVHVRWARESLSLDMVDMSVCWKRNWIYDVETSLQPLALSPNNGIALSGCVSADAMAILSLR